jgi:DNA-binding transcriptional ArsR family regulator
VIRRAGYTSIVDRRLTMKGVSVAVLLERSVARRYASWFRALADPSRVQIVEYLARQGRPMSVGEIVAAVGLAQSTVSQHLKILADVRFVLAEQVNTARHYRINEACIPCFPSAADVVMGRPAPTPTGGC